MRAQRVSVSPAGANGAHGAGIGHAIPSFFTQSTVRRGRRLGLSTCFALVAVFTLVSAVCVLIAPGDAAQADALLVFVLFPS